MTERRAVGQGHIYLRGKYFWMKYSLFGHPIYESTKTSDRTKAGRILKERIKSSLEFIPVSALHAVHAKALRTYLRLEEDKKKRFDLICRQISKSVKNINDLLTKLGEKEE